MTGVQTWALPIGDTYAPACVVAQIVYAGSVSHLLVAQSSHRRRRQRRADESHRQTADDTRPDDAAHRNLQTDVAEHVGRVGQHREAEDYQVTTVNLSDETTDNNHGDDRANPARTDGHAALHGRITHHRLQK